MSKCSDKACMRAWEETMHACHRVACRYLAGTTGARAAALCLSTACSGECRGWSCALSHSFLVAQAAVFVCYGRKGDWAQT
jgi:hypothetical protein